MKKTIAACLFLSCLIPTAHADWADQYVLAKGGIMDFDIDNTDVDPLLSFGLMYGFGLTRELSAEMELNMGLLGGEYVAQDGEDQGDYSIWTGAAYASYRLPFNETMYAKAKIGLLYESIERDSEELEDDSRDGFGLAGGLGLGVLAGQVLTLELEVTQIDQDVIFLSLGMHYSF